MGAGEPIRGPTVEGLDGEWCNGGPTDSGNVESKNPAETRGFSFPPPLKAPRTSGPIGRPVARAGPHRSRCGRRRVPCLSFPAPFIRLHRAVLVALAWIGQAAVAACVLGGIGGGVAGAALL